MNSLNRMTAHSDATIREAMAIIDRGAKGIVVIIDDDRRLLGTITDGDIRRAILAGWDLSTPVCEILADRILHANARPVTAMVSTPPTELIRRMRSRSIRHIVLLDSSQRVAEVVTLDDLIPYTADPVDAVIMAGGRGRRLMPLTDDLPKPMLPVGGRPMLEWIIEGLKRSGISKITIASHYKADVIRRYFGNGWKLGVQISHLYEERPTGTAGSLRRLRSWDGSLMVVNGDILTWVDFGAMIQYHREHAADLTIAVKKHDVQVPYGVVDMQGAEIRRLAEKPTMPYFVNAGIYILERTIRPHLGDDESIDMTQLIDRAIAAGRSVVGFPVTEYWADIGHIEDYERARDHVDGQLQEAVG